MVYHIYDVGYRSAKFGVASAASVILLLITLVISLSQLARPEELVTMTSEALSPHRSRRPLRPDRHARRADHRRPGDGIPIHLDDCSPR